MMEDQLLPVDPLIPGNPDAEAPPSEGISVSEREGELSNEEQREAAGFQFYHSDLYEPRERLEIFTEKPLEKQSQLPAVPDPSVHTHSGSLPISPPIDLQSPKGEIETGGNLMDFPNFLSGNQFDPFQQIVDCSESASQCSDRLLSPISDRMEMELESTQTGHHREPATLAKEPSRETESEMDSQEISEDTTPDVYCQSCQIPIPAFEKLFGPHRHHRVAPLSLAAEAAKLECQNNVKKLEQQVVQMETFVNHLEEIFVTVEENIGKQEHYLEVQYDDLMQFLMQGYEDRSQELEDEKKLKLEKLYGELMSCGQSIDLYKELLESTEQLYKTEDKPAFLKNGQIILARLEEFLQVDFNPEFPTTTEFEKYPIDMPEVQRLIDSISSMPDTSLKVKEMYHTVSDLKPNTVYEFWVTATNSAGTSAESDWVKHTTVPLAPTINMRAVASCQNAALIEWESRSQNPARSYTVEFCQICSGCDWTESLTESLTGITACKTLIELEANENYIFYVRALNEGGCSERSLPINVQTTGCQLYLIEETAHLSLSILDDGFTIVYNEDAVLTDRLSYDDRFTSCAAVMGQLVPVRGQHYWEVEVTEELEYRIGVASPNIPRDSYLGSNITSWCMRHTLTPSRSKFEFLHNGRSPDLRVTVPPERIGILLDYDAGKISFFNADIAQHLFTFTQPFQNLVNPCFALESSGILKISHGIPIPEFTKLP
ncbi:fibronectin type III and SPRY domain-containing protein 2 isoform X2 [Mustelus asterias]